MRQISIPEKHMRLGRHVEHDPRSKAFGAVGAAKLKSALHVRHCLPFDQGNVGSCTGNAMAGLLMTEPFYVVGRELTEADALKIYELATRLDTIAGAYPPNDTGSSGLAVAKAAKQLGYIDSYKHAFGLDHALAAIVLKPVVIGVQWFQGFYTPDRNGFLDIDGSVAGGHELEVNQINVEENWIGGPNSWGTRWGLTGYWRMSFNTFGKLLALDGDVVTASVKP